MSSSASPDVVSLLRSGGASGVSSLAQALALDQETVVPLEHARALDHFAHLRAEFEAAETRQRMLTALVKDKDDKEGMLAPLLDATTGGAQGEALAARSHAAAIAALQEKQKQSLAELSEIQQHTKAQAAAIKIDIQKMLQAWSALETSKTALEASRQEEGAMQAAAQWGAFQAAWGSVEAALAAADALGPLREEQGEARVAAAGALAQALSVAHARLDALAATAAGTGSEGSAPEPAALDLDAVSGMGSLMQRQLQSLSEWARRSEELGAHVHALARSAPRISSFAQAQADAAASAAASAAAGVAGPELAALQASRVASGVLSKLSGVAVLRQQGEEHSDESGARVPATRLTLCVATQHGSTGAAPAAAAAASTADDMYESDEAFARALQAQQQQPQSDPDLLVLSLLVLTPAQAKACPGSDPAAAAATPGGGRSVVAAGGASAADELAGCVLLAGHAMGSLSTSALATLQASAAQRSGVSGGSTGANAADSAPLLAGELERVVRPCRPGLSAAVSRAVEQALESQKLLHVRGVAPLLRDLAWEVAQ